MACFVIENCFHYLQITSFTISQLLLFFHLFFEKHFYYYFVIYCTYLCSSMEIRFENLITRLTKYFECYSDDLWNKEQRTCQMQTLLSAVLISKCIRMTKNKVNNCKEFLQKLHLSLLLPYNSNTLCILKASNKVFTRTRPIFRHST